MKTAVAYIRVSTADQTELSPDSQIKLINEYAKKEGYILPQEFIFRDDGISGRTANKRPAFNQMIALAKTKPVPFDCVLIWKFSRFARNQEESIFYKSILAKNGIEVISISEPVIDGPFGSLIERIIEWSDEYYSIRLSDEVRRGMAEKAGRGGIVTVPSYGYDAKDGKYIVNSDTAPVVKKIYSDFLAGKGASAIARELNSLGIKTTKGKLWTNKTIGYILTNDVYIGKIKWTQHRGSKDSKDFISVDGTHEHLIDKKTFNDVQLIFEKNRAKKVPYMRENVSKYNDYMLRGLIKCSNCDSNLTLAVKGKSLQCCNYIHSKCNVSHSIKIDIIDSMVINSLDKIFKTGDIKLIARHLKSNNLNINYKGKIEKEKVKLSRIQDAYENEVYTLLEYKERRDIILQTIDKFKKQMSSNSTKITKKEKKDFIKAHKKSLEMIKSSTLTVTEKRELLSSFVQKIVFDRKNCRIDILFYIF